MGFPPFAIEGVSESPTTAITEDTAEALRVLEKAFTYTDLQGYNSPQFESNMNVTSAQRITLEARHDYLVTNQADIDSFETVKAGDTERVII